MKNYTNIYDIDGNLIRKAGDNHKFTIDEVEKMVDDLVEKCQKFPENSAYKVYLNNAQSWLYKMYNEMSREDVLKRLTSLQGNLTEAKEAQNTVAQEQLDELNSAIEQLKREYESNMDTEVESGVAEPEQSVGNPEPIVMDQYVDYEEVK